MKHILFFALAAAAIVACGPAAEDREQMHARAKVFQDSIAKAIRTSMEEAAAPGPNQPPPAVADTVKAAMPQPTATAK